MLAAIKPAATICPRHKMQNDRSYHYDARFRRFLSSVISASNIYLRINRLSDSVLNEIRKKSAMMSWKLLFTTIYTFKIIFSFLEFEIVSKDRWLFKPNKEKILK